MQTLELTQIPDHQVHCPFCGDLVLPSAQETETPHPCVHTLFVVGEEGVRFRSPRFDECLDIESVPDEQVELPPGGWPDLVLRVGLPDAVQIVVVDAPPGQTRTSVGFAPVQPQAGAD